MSLNELAHTDRGDLSCGFNERLVSAHLEAGPRCTSMKTVSMAEHAIRYLRDLGLRVRYKVPV